MSIVSVLISLVVAFAVTAGLGFVIIPWLRKLHFGQTILDIGPVWHKKKQGTPNMGGLMSACRPSHWARVAPPPAAPFATPTAE